MRGHIDVLDVMAKPLRSNWFELALLKIPGGRKRLHFGSLGAENASREKRMSLVKK